MYVLYHNILHYTSLHYIALHYLKLHYIILNYIALFYPYDSCHPKNQGRCHYHPTFAGGSEIVVEPPNLGIKQTRFHQRQTIPRTTSLRPNDVPEPATRTTLKCPILNSRKGSRTTPKETSRNPSMFSGSSGSRESHPLGRTGIQIHSANFVLHG